VWAPMLAQPHPRIETAVLAGFWLMMFLDNVFG
jgi:hypothetical protein